MNVKKIYIHPLPVRIWHWSNAVGFVLLILTGLQIRYRDIIGLPPSRPRCGSTTSSASR